MSATFTRPAGSSLELGMSEYQIPQVREPGRARPYITIVDTGLAMAAQNFLAMLELWMDEASEEGLSLDDVRAKIDWERVHAISSGLHKELKQRTF